MSQDQNNSNDVDSPELHEDPQTPVAEAPATSENILDDRGRRTLPDDDNGSLPQQHGIFPEPVSAADDIQRAFPADEYTVAVVADDGRGGHVDRGPPAARHA